MVQLGVQIFRVLSYQTYLLYDLKYINCNYILTKPLKSLDYTYCISCARALLLETLRVLIYKNCIVCFELLARQQPQYFQRAAEQQQAKIRAPHVRHRVRAVRAFSGAVTTGE